MRTLVCINFNWARRCTRDLESVHAAAWMSGIRPSGDQLGQCPRSRTCPPPRRAAVSAKGRGHDTTHLASGATTARQRRRRSAVWFLARPPRSDRLRSSDRPYQIKICPSGLRAAVCPAVCLSVKRRLPDALVHLPSSFEYFQSLNRCELPWRLIVSSGRMLRHETGCKATGVRIRHTLSSHLHASRRPAHGLQQQREPHPNRKNHDQAENAMAAVLTHRGAARRPVARVTRSACQWLRGVRHAGRCERLHVGGPVIRVSGTPAGLKIAQCIGALAALCQWGARSSVTTGAAVTFSL